ncbi:MAG: carboxymuconolactone decarboxylase family protein [Nitrospirae bacterium]|nr:MAG: carboxymuconolactone decarboxylase family protein [Nitrospirota bacterium]
MGEGKLPEKYLSIKERFPALVDAVSNLGKVTSEIGPLDKKTAQLIKLAASAVNRSEGAVHSHARRALEAGATKEELYHTVILLTSTIGFPNVSAAISWIDDVLKG